MPERNLKTELRVASDEVMSGDVGELLADLRDAEIQATDDEWDGGVVDWGIGEPRLISAELPNEVWYLAFPIEVTYTVEDS